MNRVLILSCCTNYTISLLLYLNPGMPTNPYMYAGDLIDVLKKKYASGTYKSLVKYSVTVFIIAYRYCAYIYA